MEKLSTIQKREKLNDVYKVDGEGPGGAHHHYMIKENLENETSQDFHCEIKFQCGPRNDESSIHGVIDTDLLEIARDSLKSFQAGPFSSRENALALTHVEEALMWLNRRVEDRIERNVLGINKK